MIKPHLCRRLGHATLLIATLLSYGAATSRSASAGVIATFAQVGPDVTLTFSGSIISPGNSTTSTFGGAGYVDGGNDVNRLFLLVGTSFTVQAYAASRISGPKTQWGNGGGIRNNPSSTTINGINGLVFSEYFGNGSFYIPNDYVLGTEISGSMTFSGTTLASMGLDNSGTYVYSFGSSSDTYTVIIPTTGGGGGGAAVPEPSSLAVASILGVVGWHRTQRKRKQPNG